MCLQINRNSVRVAEKPITVYKILCKNNDEYVTPYTHAICKVGETLKAKTKAGPYTKEITHEGVHGYKSLFAARHSNLCHANLMIKGSFYITEWEIPKDTEYWEGVHSSSLEIAATEMKFVKVIEESKAQNDFLLRVFIQSDQINQLATHYITKEGEIKPIKKGQKLSKYQLCWSAEELEKLVPETITFAGLKGIEFKFYTKLCVGDGSIGKAKECWVDVGYQCQQDKSHSPICGFSMSTTDKGFVYGTMLLQLVSRGFLNIRNLKKTIDFEIKNIN